MTTAEMQHLMAALDRLVTGAATAGDIQVVRQAYAAGDLALSSQTSIVNSGVIKDSTVIVAQNSTVAYDEAGIAKILAVLENQGKRRTRIAERYVGRDISEKTKARLESLSHRIYGRELELETLDRFIRNNKNGCLRITGAAGLGKSSLLGNWILSRQSKEVFFVYHFFSQDLQDVDYALLNICRQLFLYYELSDEILPRKEETRDTILGLLQDYGASIDKRLVFVVDGLDEASSEFVVPLPRPLPSNVYLVLSTRDVAPDAAASQGSPCAVASDCLDLQPLGPSAITSWLEHTAFINEATASNTTAHLLFDLTRGHPLFLHFLIDDLASAKSSGQDIQQLLVSVPKGFTAYINSEFRRLSADPEVRDDGALRTMVAVLSVARGPLGQSDLIHICGLTKWRLQCLPRSVARWLRIQPGLSDQEQYLFSHPLLAREFRVALGDESDQALVSLVQYCSRWAVTRSRYAFSYFADHLLDAGRFGELWDLLTATPEWMQAKFQEFGHDGSFVADLERARINFPAKIISERQIAAFVKLLAAEAVFSTLHRGDTPTDLETLVMTGRRDDAILAARLAKTPKDRLQGYAAIMKADRSLGRLDHDILQGAIREARSLYSTRPETFDLCSLARACFGAGDHVSADALVDQALEGFLKEENWAHKLNRAQAILGLNFIGGALNTIYEAVMLRPLLERQDVGFSLARRLASSNRVTDAQAIADWYSEAEDKFYCCCCIAEGAAEGGDRDTARLLINSLTLPKDSNIAITVAAAAAASLASSSIDDLLNTLLSLPDLNPTTWTLLTVDPIATACVCASRYDDAIRFVDVIDNPSYAASLLLDLSEKAKDENGRSLLFRKAVEKLNIVAFGVDAARVLQCCWHYLEALTVTDLIQLADTVLLSGEDVGSSVDLVTVDNTVSDLAIAQACILRTAKDDAAYPILNGLARLVAEKGHIRDSRMILDKAAESVDASARQLRVLFTSPAIFSAVAVFAESDHLGIANSIVSIIHRYMLDRYRGSILPPTQFESALYLHAACLCSLGRVSEALEVTGLISSPWRLAWIRFMLLRAKLSEEAGIQLPLETMSATALGVSPRTEPLPALEFGSVVNELIAAVSGFLNTSLVDSEALRVCWAAGCDLVRMGHTAGADRMFALVFDVIGRSDISIDNVDQVASQFKDLGATEQGSAIRQVFSEPREFDNVVFEDKASSNRSILGVASAGTTVRLADLATDIASGKRLLESLASTSVIAGSLDEVVLSISIMMAPVEGISPSLTSKLLMECISIGGWRERAWRKVATLVNNVPDYGTRLNDANFFAEQRRNRSTFLLLPAKYEVGVELQAAIFASLGSRAERRQQFDVAYEAYEKAVTYSPETARYVSRYVLYLEAAGDVKKAIELIEHASAANPDYEYDADRASLAMREGMWNAASLVYVNRETKHGTAYVDHFWHSLALLGSRCFSEAEQKMVVAARDSTGYSRDIAEFWTQIILELAGKSGPLSLGFTTTDEAELIRLHLLVACYHGIREDAAGFLEKYLDKKPTVESRIAFRIYLSLLLDLRTQCAFASQLIAKLDSDWLRVSGMGSLRAS